MKHDYALEIRGWDEKVQEAIYKVSPQKYRLIEQGVTQQDRFMLAAYPFSAYIVKDGYFYLPNFNTGSTAYYNEYANKTLQNFLRQDFCISPFGLVINGCMEVFWQTENHIIPQALMTYSNFMGTRNLTDDPKEFRFVHTWNITAGARTLALLPRIQDREKYRRLKEYYNIRSDIPRTFKDQWYVFSDINSTAASNWYTNILFFSSKLSERIMYSKDFLSLRAWIYAMLRKSFTFDNNQGSLDFIWAQFIHSIENRGVKEKDYIYNAAKHLLIVAMGQEFGFVPTLDDTVAPISILTKAMNEVYELKYTPTFIHAAKLSDETDGVYCSLQNPTFLTPHASKNSHSNVSLLDDLRSIKRVHEQFFVYVQSEAGKCAWDSIVIEIPKKVKFDYFHTAQDRLKTIANCRDIVNGDSRFFKTSIKGGIEKPFCYSSDLFRGCVRIKHS